PWNRLSVPLTVSPPLTATPLGTLPRPATSVVPLRVTPLSARPPPRATRLRSALTVTPLSVPPLPLPNNCPPLLPVTVPPLIVPPGSVRGAAGVGLPGVLSNRGLLPALLKVRARKTLPLEV